jgi:penicillin G amidase
LGTGEASVVKWLIRVPVGLAMAVLVVVGAGYLWLRTSLPAKEKEVAFAALRAPVEILRDENWIPHIFADTQEDAAFALGYVHAEDRLWQMETMRRMGAGRLSEIFGSAFVDTDRYMRTLGLYALAKAQSAHASKPVKRLLESYTAGVNGWLDEREGALPPEFIALSLEPEPWDVADSMVWGPLMAWRLGTNRHEELLRARLSRQLSVDQIAELWPSHAEEGATTLAPHLELNRKLSANGILAGEDLVPAGAGASNVWALAGSKTVSGKPLLANDPHLHFSSPGTWYLARIVTPELEVSGATSPGLPFVILGHNRHIAWGMTTANADVEDYFVEVVDPSDPSRYRAPGRGWEQFRTRREVIRVRGGENVEVVLRETRHGPVISDSMPGLAVPVDDKAPDKGEQVLAFAATYLRQDAGSADAIFALNRARNWEGFLAALKRYDITPQNIFYADVDGNIGFIMPGLIPIRRSGKGLMPTAGWTGDTDWIGFIAYDQLPRVFNPDEGLLINANNKMVPDDYPWFVSNDWGEPFRAQRIAELMATRSLLSIDEMSAMQIDTMSLMARQLLPKMLAKLPDDFPLPESAGGLASWAGVMDRDRSEPLIFEAWLREFNRAVYADELGDSFTSYWSHRPLFIDFVLEKGAAWCDDSTKKTQQPCSEVLAQSLDAALQMLEDDVGPEEDWRWGAVHNAQFTHDFFSQLPVASRFASRSIPAGGGAYTINRVANFLGSMDQPFAGRHGAGYRAVYDLSNLSDSRFMIVPGQSGNPMSGFYDNLLETWRDGGWIEMKSQRDRLRREAEARLLLLPRKTPH